MVVETDAGPLVNIEINNNAAYGYDVRGELVCKNGSVFLNAPGRPPQQRAGGVRSLRAGLAPALRRGLSPAE